METLQKIIDIVNMYLSDYVLVILLAGTGIFFTLRTGFVQVRCFKEGLKNAFGGLNAPGRKNSKGISSFQALATAVAAQVGTGNIVGASGAILTGGPGALFWMWIISFFGMATIYAEAVLSQQTRKVLADGSIQGGPVYYIKKAFRGKCGNFMAGFFALAAVLALGFMGIMVQSNAISSAINSALGIGKCTVGLAVTLLAALILTGGIGRIASVAEKLVPFMAIMYIAGGLIILACRIKYLPESFAMIFQYAFNPKAIIGGSFGSAMKTVISQGVKRGLFSNEAGMGSTPHAHAVAKVRRPHDQGVVAMIGVFIDTFAVLTTTGLIIISTLYAGGGPLSAVAIPEVAEGINQNNMVQLSLSNTLGSTSAGNIFVAICIFFFAFSSIISWNYFGRINAHYLGGKKAVRLYMTISVGFIFLGSVLSGNIVWGLADMFNQLMVIPNVVSLIALSAHVANARSKK